MTDKKNSLQAVLEAANKSKKEAQEPAPAAQQAKKPKKKITKAPDTSVKRGEDTSLIGGHFAKSVAKQLRFLAVEEDKTNQELLGEALDLLFIKKGKKLIGDLT